MNTTEDAAALVSVRAVLRKSDFRFLFYLFLMFRDVLEVNFCVWCSRPAFYHFVSF